MVSLDVKNLFKSFGGLKAIRDVNLEVQEGEIHGLIGPNGAGKTTFFNLVTGLYKPDSGLIYFEGENITGMKPHVICKKGLTRTFQIPHLFSSQNVLANVMVGAAYGKVKSTSLDTVKREANEILEFVGLARARDVLASKLSVHEQKMLELAKALSTKPKLLLLDEIAAGLNIVEVAEVVGMIRKMRESGITILMVEHVMKVVMDVSDQITVLSSGEKIAEGKPGEISRDEKVIKVYLGETYA
jgi:branched-chain amino acid transport system ATP-binding protein